MQISFESDLHALARHHAKKTRKGAVYQLARTCTQERLGQSVKIIANADDICSRKQANEIKRRIRNFLEVLSSKKRQTIFTSHERSRSHATTTISEWNFLMMESGKNIFQSYFLDTWRS